MSAWQPIKTAPKDGSHVQLWRDDIQFTGYYSGFRGGSWIINAPGLPVIDPLPTHWQPLPPPPESTT